MSARQRYRFRAADSDVERIIDAEPGKTYVDRDSGKPLEPVGMLLPLAPSQSRLPWSVENLRFCPWCAQHFQRDLNECPTCGRRVPPLGHR